MGISAGALNTQVLILRALREELRLQCRSGYHVSLYAELLPTLRKLQQAVGQVSKASGIQLMELDADTLLFKLLDDIQWVKALLAGWPYTPKMVVKPLANEIKTSALTTLLLTAPAHRVRVVVGLASDNDRCISIRLVCTGLCHKSFYVHWPLTKVTPVLRERIAQLCGSYPPTEYIHPKAGADLSHTEE